VGLAATPDPRVLGLAITQDPKALDAGYDCMVVS